MSPNSAQSPGRSKALGGGIAVGCLFAVGAVVLVWRGLDPPAPLADEESPGQSLVQTASDATSQASLSTLPGTEKAKLRQDSLSQYVDAPQDSWPTEAFSERASSVLKQGLHDIAEGSQPASVFPDCVAEPLRPNSLDTVYETDMLVCRRSPKNPSASSVGLTDGFAKLGQGIVGKYRIDAKVVKVSESEQGYETIVFVEGGGETSNGMRQWNAEWKCDWLVAERPVLKSIQVVDYQEVIAGAGRWLSESTAAVLNADASLRDQLNYGMDYWVNRLEHRFYVNRLGHHGLAVADINGDGREDLYVCQAGGLPNRLYLHQADGTAVEAAKDAGVAFLDDTTAALFVDLDNDGDQDLCVLTVSGGFVFANDGAGNFTQRGAMPGCRNAFSLTAADYDSDGLLDLYIGRYWPDASERGTLPLPVPYYDATNGGRNILLRNRGGLDFEDVTATVGLNQDNTRYSMAAAWEDYDNDGDQDLYVANDFGRNCLYRNDNGVFVNVALAMGVEDTAAGMSVAWSDYDHDGRMDLYVGNMFSSAGNRVAYQRQYQARFDADAQQKLQRLARGNSLFRNASESFQDVTLESGASMGRWAWGSLFVDLNNDSWDDLVIANGHVTTHDTGDL